MSATIARRCDSVGLSSLRTHASYALRSWRARRYYRSA